MGLKQCDKCSEMVDEAKAYCPGCGNAFVEEKTRQEASGYERMDPTVQLGQTMYDQMLSDMGLNISKPPDIVEKRVEIIAPVATAPKPQPAPIPIPATAPVVKSSKKWLYIAGAVILVLVFLLVIALAALVFIYVTRFR
ncbi:MAG: hypothetical protein ABJB40_01430 [Acidobacteriota bacterium]